MSNFSDDSAAAEIGAPATLRFDEYDSLSTTYIAQGGYGTVVSMSRRGITGHDNAMKFFGYKIFGQGSRRPDMEWIMQEIRLLEKLSSIAGCAMYHGFFWDSSEGFLSDKIVTAKDPWGRPYQARLVKEESNRQPYPVIVMERLYGREFFEAVADMHNRGSHGFSEQKASSIMRKLVLTLTDIHEDKNVILVDLKIENLVFISEDPNNLSFKFIDFGMAVDLGPNSRVHRSTRRLGTGGNYAPETFDFYYEIIDENSCTRRQKVERGIYEYSKKTDIWQAGIVLYSMLCANSPFSGSTDEETERRISLGRYHELPAWLSAEAKDLIRKIFNPDPRNRLSCNEILEHAFLDKAVVSDADLGEEYRASIAAWNDKRKFQHALHRSVAQARERNQKLSRVIPPLMLTLSVADFKSLRKIFSETIRKRKRRRIGSVDDVVSDLGLDFTQFKSLVSEAKLPALGSKDIFDALDTDSSGCVDYVEFLLGLSSFITGMVSNSDDKDNDKLNIFFEIFDVDGDGTISKNELLQVMKNFLVEIVPEDVPDGFLANFNVDRLFYKVDRDHNDRIDRAEFRNFMLYFLDAFHANLPLISN